MPFVIGLGALLAAAIVEAIIIVLCIVALIIVAVIIIDWLINVAVPWLVHTAEQVWSAYVDPAIVRVRTRLEELEDDIEDVIRRGLPKTHRVYHLLMMVPGEYKKREWGYGWGAKHNFPEDCMGDPTFKYGTTRNTIESRYRSGYIKELFEEGKLRGVYLTPKMIPPMAYATEKSLILAYYLRHKTKPPGNSKFG